MDARPLEGVKRRAAGVRSLVVLPNWVGDTVLALPALAALAASGRELVLLARPGLEPLLRCWGPGVEVLPKSGGEGALIRRLAAAACQEAVVLPNSFRSAWLPFRAGIPWRWGYAGGGRSALLRPAVPRPGAPEGGGPRRADSVLVRFAGRLAGRSRVPFAARPARRHQSLDYRELLAAMDVAPPASWVPRLLLSARAREDGRGLLARAGLDAGGGPLVGLFPGAEFGPSKRWPWGRFAELAERLRERLPGVRIVLVAGPRERWLAVRIHEEAGRRHPVVGPDLDLGRLAGVLACLDLLVTNDSGPMHLAAALGVPCAALFGPTDPRRTAPAGDGHRILSTGRWCAPCLRRRCPLLHYRCLRDLGAAEVLAAAGAILEERVARHPPL